MRYISFLCLLLLGFGVSATSQAQSLNPAEQCQTAGEFNINTLHKAQKKAYLRAKKQSRLFQVWAIAEQVSSSPLYGIDRNKIVLQLVCLGGLAPLAKDAAINARYQIWQNKESQRFNLCNFVTSGAGQGYCAVREAKRQQRELTLELRRTVAHKTVDIRDFAQLAYQRSSTFFTLKAEKEELNGGSGFVAWQTESIQRQKMQYLNMLKRVVAKTYPLFNISFSEQDRTLNRVYRQVLVQLNKQPIEGGNVSVNVTGVREVQRSWLRYRDTNARLFALLYPKVKIKTWQAILTQDRIEQLKAILKYRPY